MKATMRRFMCWIRGGHRWDRVERHHDERACTRCGYAQYAWAETVDGCKSWTAVTKGLRPSKGKTR